MRRYMPGAKEGKSKGAPLIHRAATSSAPVTFRILLASSRKNRCRPCRDTLCKWSLQAPLNLAVDHWLKTPECPRMSPPWLFERPWFSHVGTTRCQSWTPLQQRAEHWLAVPELVERFAF